MELKKSILICLLFSVIFISCSEQITDQLISNVSPETHLFLYPDSSLSKQSSNLKVHWWGDDADGLIVGYFMKWEGIDSKWGFTSKNDSSFYLPIGSIDTSFIFKVSAIDNNGNGQYDDQIIRDGINFGPEPFTDTDNNNKYTPGEKFIDIGNVDTKPAELRFPIRNSSPVIAFNVSSVMPDTSLPVLTLTWDVKDLDGIQSVTGINIALNDTLNYVTLDGNTRMVTLRVRDFSSNSPQTEILLNGDESKMFFKKLNGLKLNDTNVVYIQAQDIAGSKSRFVRQSNKSCFIRKPKGEVLVINDFDTGVLFENRKTISFYKEKFDSLYSGRMNGKYDFLDLRKDVIPYKNISFLKIMKLYKYIYWYSTSRPSLDLLTVNVSKFMDNGGRMAFSLLMEEPSKLYNFDWNVRDLQAFLPVDSLSYKESQILEFNPGTISPMPGFSYPVLVNSKSMTAVRTVYPNPSVAKSIYSAASPNVNGPIGFVTNDKTMFYIGLPLNYCDKNKGSVKKLLQKVFEDFGLVL